MDTCFGLSFVSRLDSEGIELITKFLQVSHVLFCDAKWIIKCLFPQENRISCTPSNTVSDNGMVTVFRGCFSQLTVSFFAAVSPSSAP